MLKKEVKKLVTGLAPYERYRGGYTVVISDKRKKVKSKVKLVDYIYKQIKNNDPISIAVITNKKSNSGDWIPDKKHTIYEDNSIIEQIKKEYSNDFKKSRAEIKAIDLYQIYDKLKKLYFSNKNEVDSSSELKWSARLSSSAGNCRQKSKLIKLSVDYHRKHPDEIEDTLIHEMIHLYVDGHSQEFNNEIKRINEQAGENVVSRYSQESANVSHVAYCPKHKVVGTRTNSPKSNANYTCSRCNSKIRWIKVD